MMRITPVGRSLFTCSGTFKVLCDFLRHQCMERLYKIQNKFFAY
jgi:hypothetical protein